MKRTFDTWRTISEPCLYCGARNPCERCNAMLHSGIVTRVNLTDEVLHFYRDVVAHIQEIGPGFARVSTEVVFLITEEQEGTFHRVYRVIRTHPLFHAVMRYNITYLHEIQHKEEQNKDFDDIKDLSLNGEEVQPFDSSDTSEIEVIHCKYGYAEQTLVPSIAPFDLILSKLPTTPTSNSPETVPAAWALRKEYCREWKRTFGNDYMPLFPLVLFDGYCDPSVVQRRDTVLWDLGALRELTTNARPQYRVLRGWMDEYEKKEPSEFNTALIAYLKTVLPQETPEKKEFAADVYLKFVDAGRDQYLNQNLSYIPLILYEQVREFLKEFKGMYTVKLIPRDSITVNPPTFEGLILPFIVDGFDAGWLFQEIRCFGKAVLQFSGKRVKNGIVWCGMIDQYYILTVNWD